MVDTAIAACIEYQIARLHISRSDLLSHFGLRAGIVRKRYSEFLHYLHGKAGAVYAVCQAGTAPDIRISHKLNRIVHYLRAA